jgi:hypothetical protein
VSERSEGLDACGSNIRLPPVSGLRSIIALYPRSASSGLGSFDALASASDGMPLPLTEKRFGDFQRPLTGFSQRTTPVSLGNDAGVIAGRNDERHAAFPQGRGNRKRAPRRPDAGGRSVLPAGRRTSLSCDLARRGPYCPRDHPKSGDIRRSGYILGETPQTTMEPQDWGMLRMSRRRPGIAGSIGATQLRRLGNTAPGSMSLPSRRATRTTQFCRIIPSENR